MPHRDPQNYSFFDWILLVAVSIWAAVSSFIKRDLSKVSIKKALYFALQDFTISGGVATLTIMALQSYGIQQGLSYAIGGYAGHKATRFMYLIEIYLEKKVGIDTKEKNG